MKNNIPYMLNLTPTVQLSEKMHRRYMALRALLFILFCAFGVWMLSLLLFPSQTLVFDFNNPNSLKNTLTTPTRADGILTTHAGVLGTFSTMDITVHTAEKDALARTDAATATVRHAYQALLAPQGEDVTFTPPEEPFPSGSLLSSADAVFAVDGNTLRAFDSAETFTSLGFSFDDVLSTDSEQRAQFDDGSLITLRAMHPAGTVFHATDTETFFLFDGSTIHTITNPAAITQPVIPVEEAQRTTTAQCTLAQHPLFARRHHCTVPLATIADFTSNNFAIALALPDTVTMTALEVTLSKSLTTSNREQRIAEIKNRILQRYE